MTQKTYERAEAERMAPLLQSMTREIQERTKTVAKLERSLAALDSEGAPKSDRALLRSEIYTAFQGLQAVRKEAKRLGLAIDDSQPPRIVVPCEGGDWIYGGSLDGTNFYRLEPSTA